jgi:hypothetical protein
MKKTRLGAKLILTVTCLVMILFATPAGGGWSLSSRSSLRATFLVSDAIR